MTRVPDDPVVALTNPKVGLLAVNRAGTTTDLRVAFDYFHVSERP
jgi:hypothetical protein